MSRIGGIVSHAHGMDVERIMRSMLDRMAAAGAEEEMIRGERSAFAYSGRAAGRVAMHDGVMAALDGHFYNAGELGQNGDGARTLIDLYRRHGFEEALRRINGDFAVALLDRDGQTLWLGRDRIGVKPLYYARFDDGIAFASRPGALMAVPGISSEPLSRFVGLYAASHYRLFDNDPCASPFADVQQLPAGSFLRIDPDGATEGSYWRLLEEEDFQEDEAALAERYRELLLDSVAIRLAMTSRPAFTLSGGMDSSSVLACAVEALGCAQTAFSSVYEDKTFDESDDIRSMLQDKVERWEPVLIDPPDLFDLVRRMVRAHDEPVATATWLSHFLVCERAASSGRDALFGGLGGDELNAGEYEYFAFHFADLRAAGDEARLAREIDFWARYHDHPIYRKGPEAAEKALASFVDFSVPGRCLPDMARMRRYAHVLNPDYFDVFGFVPEMDRPFSSYLKNRTYQDIFRETAPCCLRAEDRQTVHFGLEHFLPFFDYRLVEFMYRVPGALKIRDGVTKHLLRQAMRGILPEETRTRIKKTGWNAPAHVWFTKKTSEALRDLASGRRFRERGVYKPDEVLRIIDEHERIVQSGACRENHMMFLWQLLNLEMWFEEIEGGGFRGL